MTYEEITGVLNQMGLEYAYNEFQSPPKGDAYIAYFEQARTNEFADNRVYNSEQSYAIELYTKKKRRDLEEKLIGLLNDNEIPWTDAPEQYIASDHIYQKAFYV